MIAEGDRQHLEFTPHHILVQSRWSCYEKTYSAYNSMTSVETPMSIRSHSGALGVRGTEFSSWQGSVWVLPLWWIRPCSHLPLNLSSFLHVQNHQQKVLHFIWMGSLVVFPPEVLALLKLSPSSNCFSAGKAEPSRCPASPYSQGGGKS